MLHIMLWIQCVCIGLVKYCCEVFTDATVTEQYYLFGWHPAESKYHSEWERMVVEGFV